jgi:predicted amidophosphoribosyltransferase
MMKQQLCSYCWEEIAVLSREGLAWCENCLQEHARSEALAQDLRQALAQPIKDWITRHLDEEEEILQSALEGYFSDLAEDDVKSLLEMVRQQAFASLHSQKGE